MEKIEEEWEFDELKIIRELAMLAIEEENKAAEVKYSVCCKKLSIYCSIYNWFESNVSRTSHYIHMHVHVEHRKCLYRAGLLF